MIVPRIVTATTSDAMPIDLDAARKFCRVDEHDDDAELSGMIATAFGWLQPPRGCLRVSIAPQTLRVDLPCWPVRAFELPAGPVSSIASVKYSDEDNAEQTVDPSNYFLDNETIIFVDTFSAPSLYDRPSAVRITYAAGYASGACDETLRMALLRIVKQLYDFRDEMVGGVSFDADVFGVGDLIRGYRVR